MRNLRRVIRELYRNLPESKRSEPKMKKLGWELASKDVDFSRTAIEDVRRIFPA